MRGHTIAASPRQLLLIVFLAGIGTLGIEMVMPRLLAPFFGTSQPIWAVVIGSTLLYLAAGYWLGGWLADRGPDPRVLFRLIAWAGLCCGVIPTLARPVLAAAQQAFLSFAAGNFLAALGGAVLLFAAPVLLLAAVSPFAVRLALHESGQGVAAAGRVAGRISALSTLGSIVGTFGTVLLLIPWIGTTRTLYLFAAFLLLVALPGVRDWRYWLLAAAVGGLAWLTLAGGGTIRAATCYRCELLAEAESSYNYIQVVRQEVRYLDDPLPDVRHSLLLNEGHALHSIYRLRYRETGDPLDLLTDGGPWDYFAVAPYFYPQRDPSSIRSMAMLGAAAGTVPMQMLATYGAEMQIDAVEIDPAIVAMARQHFDLSAGTPAAPNYTMHVADARAWLARLPAERTYDIIGVDAYHQPYIPFHLTTVEFFAEVRAHLAPDGVVMVNVARSPGGDERLVNALAGTMQQVFPQVFIIDTRGDRPASNAMVVGVARPMGDGVAHFAANAEQMTHPSLGLVMYWALHEGAGPVREFVPAPEQMRPFTDDRAPVEWLIDQMIVAEAQRLTQ
ncbi:MAG: fused MFS/spermidine synthase [Chloroflexaceae bacterium]|nr:fused MFS/spermidine synthase [Chloroflexaceae bacterium]